MNIEKYKFVFVVLVYGNYSDLLEFIQSIKTHNIQNKIVVVNSEYSYEVDEKIEFISKKNNCDYIKIENRGYGYGNNVGISFAKKHYLFEYIIVSNPDVIIKKFNSNFILNQKNIAIGPLITTKTNKLQNPYWFLRNRLGQYLIYISFKKNIRMLFIIPVIVNKLLRFFAILLLKTLNLKSIKVYALHGSFLMIHNSILNKVDKIYDEDMFLYSEEAHVANLFRKLNIKSLVSNQVIILHKEDGSLDYLKSNKNFVKESYITYYEKSRKKYG